MKFSQLTIGQQFHYKGQSYQKVSPVMAALCDGEGQKLIPRSAKVDLPENPTNKKPKSSISRENVKKGFSDLQDILQQLVQETSMDDDVKQALITKQQHYIGVQLERLLKPK